MPDLNAQFIDTINDFIESAPDNVDRVYKNSMEAVMRQANTTESQGGLLPVDTGDLRDSICVSSTTGAGFGPLDFPLTIQSAEPHAELVGGWTVPYASIVEFGTGAVPPRPFARTAASSWQFIVEQERIKVNP